VERLGPLIAESRIIRRSCKSLWKKTVHAGVSVNYREERLIVF